MAQTGFFLSDEGRTVGAQNGSSTTAITAGDLLYAPTNNDVLTGTAASAAAAYAVGDIVVRRSADSGTGFKTFVGVAVEDIPASGYGAVAMEGVFIHAVSADTEAGDALMGVASVNKVKKIADAVMATATTTGLTNIKLAVDNQRYNCGKALSGGSADGKYVIWKLR